jgi:hypothetical protein
VVGKDGQSLRQTLEAVKKQTGKAPKELINPVELPIILRDEWEYFLKLNASRTAGMSSHNPISEQEIYYFFRNRKIDAQSWQIDLIRRLDVVALNVEK